MIAINSHPEPTLPNAPRLRGAMGRGEPGGGIACSRLSDSGEGVKEWGRRKSVGRFSFRIRAFHIAAPALSQFRRPDYLSAWNRLEAERSRS